MVSLGKYSIFKDQKWPWKKEFHTDFLMATQVKLLKISGMWPVYWIYSLIIDFLVVQIAIYYYVTFITHLLNNGTITEITDALTSAVIYSYVSFGELYFQYNYKECDKIINYLNENFRMRSAKGLTYVTTEPTFIITKRLTVIWMCMGLSSAIHLCFYPITVQKRQLPLDCWYPYDVEPSPIFELTYLSQCFAQVVVAFVYTLSGMYLLSLVMLTCGQYDILFCSLKNIRNTAMIENLPKTKLNLTTAQRELNLDEEELNQYYYSYERKEDLMSIEPIQENNHKKNRSNQRKYLAKDLYLMGYHEELSDALRNCINHHRILLEFGVQLESFFHPLILFKSLQTTSQICSLAFVSSKTKDSSLLATVNKLEYLFLTFLELFLFGYSGENLKYQSTRVGEALLRCPWYLCSGPIRSAMVLILQNALKPSILTGGKFFTLDYMKVKGIMAASFSYYTLLEKL